MRHKKWIPLCVVLLMLIMSIAVIAEEHIPSPEQTFPPDVSDSDNSDPQTPPDVDPDDDSVHDQDPTSPQTGEEFPLLWVTLAIFFGALSLAFAYLGLKENKDVRKLKNELKQTFPEI